MTPSRDQLVEEVDQALAALRRVILRAIDAPAKPPTILQAIRATALKAPGPATAHQVSKPPSIVAAGGVEVDLGSGTISFGGAMAYVPKRQAQLAAVLAKASPNFVARADALDRAWPDMSGPSRETTAAPAIRALAEALIPLKLNAEAKKGYGIRMWASESAK